jgi:hypothetical protein
VIKAKPEEDFHQIKNNCHKFSNRLWEIMKAKEDKAAKTTRLA